MRIFIVQHRTRSHGSLKTASVDYETDHKIQDTIANEFKDRTILCIARALNTVVPEVSLTDTRTIDRLRTIIGYDRICVLDAGAVAVCHHVSIVRSYELIFFLKKRRNSTRPLISTWRMEFSEECVTSLQYPWTTLPMQNGPPSEHENPPTSSTRLSINGSKLF